MSISEAQVNNGVNVEALIDARQRWNAPERRSSMARNCTWLNGTHSRSTVEDFYGLGEEQKHRTSFIFDADHPEIFASEDHGATPVEFVLVGLASCLTAGVAAVAQHRDIQLRSVSATLEGAMDVRGILGIDSDVRNGFSGIKVTYTSTPTPRPTTSRRSSRSRRSARPSTTSSPTRPTSRSRSAEPTRGAERRGDRVRTTTTVVIGAGHAGLAMSRCLAERSIDHVVLERGEVANSWRTERWDSLRLLTPNWQSRLPGFGYDGDDPDGFRTMPEVIDFIERYATTIAAPVRTHTDGHLGAPQTTTGYQVVTDQGDWHCRTRRARHRRVQHRRRSQRSPRRVPAAIATLTPRSTATRTSSSDGGVLVVGASATGTQLADEIHRSGRPVTLAVGEHVRAPRIYRGRDILWWMDARRRARRALRRGRRHRPGPQRAVAATASAHPTPDDVDLNALTDDRRQARRPARRHQRRQGPVLRLAAQRVRARRPQDGPAARHDRRVGREPRSRRRGRAAASLSRRPRSKHRRRSARPHARRIRTIIWATGFRPDYSWLDVPVLDRKGRIRHDGGVVAAPGLY